MIEEKLNGVRVLMELSSNSKSVLEASTSANEQFDERLTGYFNGLLELCMH